VSHSSLKQLIDRQAELIAALDAMDVDRIEKASSALAEAVAVVRSRHAFHTDGSERSMVEHGLKQSDAARMRVNYLAEVNRQRIDHLAEIRGGQPSLTYSNTPK
jgi:SAM-dependent MidA family methyltransferase